MCIRDRLHLGELDDQDGILRRQADQHHQADLRINVELLACLLYTSDAADERSSVDLGGRRIIKKKKYNQYVRRG